MHVEQCPTCMGVYRTNCCVDKISELERALEEREGAMHNRIRAGYNKAVADSWRAEVAKRDAEIQRLREAIDEVHKVLASDGIGPLDHILAIVVRTKRATPQVPTKEGATEK